MRRISRLLNETPPVVAKGVAAHAALIRWAHRRENYQIGSAVWHYGTDWRGATVTKISRCRVLALDTVSQRFHVADIDRPHRQFYARRSELQPRYVGQLGPEEAL